NYGQPGEKVGALWKKMVFLRARPTRPRSTPPPRECSTTDTRIVPLSREQGVLLPAAAASPALVAKRRLGLAWAREKASIRLMFRSEPLDLRQVVSQSARTA